MRSRDGNYPFTLRLCTVILLSYPLALFASEYLISYRYVVQDATLYNESFAISKSMTKCTGSPSQTIIFPSPEKKNLKQLISLHKEAFLAYIEKLPLNIESQDTTTNQQTQSTLIVTLKTTCFKVDFNDSFVTITHLKEPQH